MKKLKPQQQLKKAEVELERQLPTIKLEAQKCHSMLRKPCVHDVEDLVHEGVIAFFSAYTGYDNTKTILFSTFFHKILINHLNSILIKSYGRPYDKDKSLPPLVTTGDEYVVNRIQKRFNMSISICNLTLKLNGLSRLAMEYIVLCVNTPEEAQKRIVENPRLKFEIIRECLGIKWEKDFQVRKEITQMLEK